MSGLCNMLHIADAGESPKIENGALVIVYENVFSLKAVTVDPSRHFENKFGHFHMKEWVGKPYGTKIYGRNGQGFVYLLQPTPELWSLVLRHRTQILYVADISLICANLELRPGSVVLESGTGSGSLTHSLCRAVAPLGHVHTFEFHPERASEAKREFSEHGLSQYITVQQRNIEELGFPEDLHGKADGVFLDLPGPYKVVPSVAKCLVPDGKFCAFSPCIEQVQKTCETLAAHNFVDIHTIECLLRPFDVEVKKIAKCPSYGAKGEKRAAEDGTAPEAKVQKTEPTDVVDVHTNEGEDGGSEIPAACVSSKEVEKETVIVVDSKKGIVITGISKEVEVQAGSVALSKEGETDRQQRGRDREAAELPEEFIRTVMARPAVEAKGHTGYLTFARKFVC